MPKLRHSHLVSIVLAIAPSLAVAPRSVALQAAASPASPLVFDSVTVVDVEDGRLRRDQRVVIAGNRIQAIGDIHTVKVPAGAQVVEARGKYLIPGLWDLHVHPWPQTATITMYPLFIINGVTGVRNASTEPLDTFLQWRREILAGTRVGPPRQILASVQINDSLLGASYGPCNPLTLAANARCPSTTAEVRRLVDSLQAAGADMIKTYILTPSMYFALAAEARRVGIPFGGHVNEVPALPASDSGARIIDHFRTDGGRLDTFCVRRPDHIPGLEECQPVAERLRKNDTWWVPTLIRSLRTEVTQELGLEPVYDSVLARLDAVVEEVRSGSTPRLDWLHDLRFNDGVESRRFLAMLDRVGMPILTGSDTNDDPHAGFGLHAELASLVALGLTPLHALQAATLDPARMWHATDSLGAVAVGKLADLVLLDADPLVDITNTTKIRAVVTNGRYFGRAALDSLLADVQTKAHYSR